MRESAYDGDYISKLMPFFVKILSKFKAPLILRKSFHYNSATLNRTCIPPAVVALRYELST